MPAGTSFVQSVSGISTGTSAKTIQVLSASSSRAVDIRSIEIGFDGTSTTGPQVLVEILKGTFSGGSGSSAANPVATNPDQTQSITATGVSNYTSEPTFTGNVVFRQYVHPQGKYLWIPPDENAARLPVNKSIAVRVTTATAVNYAGNIYASE